VKKTSQELCDDWNASHAVGTPVWLERDDFQIVETSTRSKAYVCDAGAPVIFLDGVRGYYLLHRVSHRGVDR
jgi:hypothetical protein